MASPRTRPASSSRPSNRSSPLENVPGRRLLAASGGRWRWKSLALRHTLPREWASKTCSPSADPNTGVPAREASSRSKTRFGLSSGGGGRPQSGDGRGCINETSPTFMWMRRVVPLSRRDFRGGLKHAASDQSPRPVSLPVFHLAVYCKIACMALQFTNLSPVGRLLSCVVGPRKRCEVDK